MNKAIVIYWSATGNTEKVARAITDGLRDGGMDVELRKVKEAEGLDFFDYDLVCVGSPAYHWHVPKPVDDYLKTIFKRYSSQGRVKVGAPKIPGKNALVFCTFSGPHTGMDEAVPVGKYIGQFLAHCGFAVLDEWYVLSEFHKNLEFSTRGPMGDTRGLPSERDLAEVRQKAGELASRL